MKEKILVPLDGSKVGEAALPYVESLVTKFLPDTRVEVTLMQVLSSMSHYVVAGEATARIPFTEDEIVRMKNAAESYLDKAGKVLRDKGVETSTKVVIGNAAEEILKAADEIDVDFIAMSSHGRSGISRWAFGSVTDRVVRGGCKPVLVVKSPKDIK
jgi:nucleotide-binding universal stress UspA family protein